MKQIFLEKYNNESSMPVAEAESVTRHFDFTKMFLLKTKYFFA